MIVLLVRKLWFNALCIGPVIVIKEDKYSKQLLNHEYIHFRQQLEMGFVFAYLWYLIEFLIKLAYYRNLVTAYYSVSFEREAYGFQGIIGYAGNRKPYAWWYLVNVKKRKEYNGVMDQFLNKKSAPTEDNEEAKIISLKNPFK